MADAPDPTAQIQALMRAPMPRLYANGFGFAQTASDISVVLLHNNNPTGMLSMSYISAKSFLIDLGKTIEGIEAALKQPIPTMAEVAEELEKVQGQDKPSV
jgi:hypothetical protein